MSAEVLRRAAALMRERAEAAHAGPWCFYEPSVDTFGEGAECDVVYQGDAGTLAALADFDTDPLMNDYPDPTPIVANADTVDGRHIASWHPAVALAVANWLEAEARAIEFDTGVGLTEAEALSGIGSQALAVARAYLGADA